MAMEFSDIQITRSPLVPQPPLFDEKCGAVLDFLGVVRGVEGDRLISGIDYEAYEEMALRQLKRVAGETAAKFRLRGVTLHHRVGLVPVAEASLFLRVSSGHRQEAFAGSLEIIERLKQEVPIWKHPQPVEGAA